MKAAIYARYSSDLQRDASIEDQARVCTALAERLGARAVEVFSDYGVSGSTQLRPGLQQLLAAMREGHFELVLAEALDRLSRDQEHVAGLYKQFSFAGVKMVTHAEGEISELHVGLKGTMNALFLKDLALKTHRGMEGRVRQGKAAGGKAYGYQIVRTLDAHGEPVRGNRAIDTAEAAIVRRIFTEFAAGRSPMAIARTLNTEGVPGPDGGAWQDTTLRGHHQRGTGILRNRLYIGELVWNRMRFIKDPTTGKRVSRPNPESEWVVEQVADLRIVDHDLWDRVHHRLQGIRESDQAQAIRSSEFWKHRRPQHLLTGLTYCGCCGGILSNVGRDYLACGAARNKSTCTNTRGIRREVIETLILDALRTRLMAPELVKEFIAEFIVETNRFRAEAEAGRVSQQRELSQITRKLTGLYDAIADGLRTPGLKEQLLELEHRKGALEERLGTPVPPLPRLHPNLAEVYRTKVQNLHLALGDPATQTEATEIIQTLIERVVVTPVEGKSFEFELIGDIAAMVAMGADSKKPAPGGTGVLGPFASSVKVVAGARFELTTFRL